MLSTTGCLAARDIGINPSAAGPRQPAIDRLADCRAESGGDNLSPLGIQSETQDDTTRPPALAAVKDISTATLGDQIDDCTIPPPVYIAMRGQFLALDLDEGSLTARLPVLETYLNTCGTDAGRHDRGCHR